jgi:hypothetical protein
LSEKEYIKLKAEYLKKNLKLFPSDFISVEDGRKMMLPEKNLVPGKEFFGSVELITSDGSMFYLSESSSEAKYIIYSRQNGLKEISLPLELKKIEAAVSKYEQYLDSLMKDIGKEFRKQFPEGDQTSAVSSVFRHLNLARY